MTLKKLIDKKDQMADWIIGGTYVMKQCYDTANDPEYADVCVVKEADGSVHNRCTHINQSVEDLLKKQLMTRLICHRVGGCMQRCMGSDALNALFSVTYDEHLQKAEELGF